MREEMRWTWVPLVVVLGVLSALVGPPEGLSALQSARRSLYPSIAALATFPDDAHAMLKLARNVFTLAPPPHLTAVSRIEKLRPDRLLMVSDDAVQLATRDGAFIGTRRHGRYLTHTNEKLFVWNGPGHRIEVVRLDSGSLVGTLSPASRRAGFADSSHADVADGWWARGSLLLRVGAKSGRVWIWGPGKTAPLLRRLDFHVETWTIAGSSRLIAAGRGHWATLNLPNGRQRSGTLSDTSRPLALGLNAGRARLVIATERYALMVDTRTGQPLGRHRLGRVPGEARGPSLVRVPDLPPYPVVRRGYASLFFPDPDSRVLHLPGRFVALREGRLATRDADALHLFGRRGAELHRHARGYWASEDLRRVVGWPSGWLEVSAADNGAVVCRTRVRARSDPHPEVWFDERSGYLTAVTPDGVAVWDTGRCRLEVVLPLPPSPIADVVVGSDRVLIHAGDAVSVYPRNGEALVAEACQLYWAAEPEAPCPPSRAAGAAL